MNQFITIRDVKVVNETVEYLESLLARSSMIGLPEREKAIDLKVRLDRLSMDLIDPCEFCEIKSCGYRPDSVAECIYYLEQIKYMEKP